LGMAISVSKIRPKAEQLVGQGRDDGG
jgi:hypothetical protein